MNKILIIVFIFFSFVFPVSVFAQEKIENAGFMPVNIWYSKDPFFAGDTILIHTIVFNSSSDNFSGTVDFYDGETLLGSAPFSIGVNGQFKDISISWKVSEGYHKIFALIKGAKLIHNGISSSVTLGNEKSDESEKFVSSNNKSESATTTVKNFFDEKTDLAKEYADKNLPAPITKSVNAVNSVLEDFRSSGKVWADQKGAELNQKISDLKNDEAKNTALGKSGTENTLSSVEKPLAYVYAFFVYAISYVLDNVLFFYGALFLILLFIFRMIKRIFFF